MSTKTETRTVDKTVITVSLGADAGHAEGDLVQVVVCHLLRDREGRKLAASAIGLRQGEIVSVGSYWSDSRTGTSGRYYAVEVDAIEGKELCSLT